MDTVLLQPHKLCQTAEGVKSHTVLRPGYHEKKKKQVNGGIIRTFGRYTSQIYTAQGTASMRSFPIKNPLIS